MFGVERLFFESVVNDTFEDDSEESKHSEGHEDEDHEEDYSGLEAYALMINKDTV